LAFLARTVELARRAARRRIAAETIFADLNTLINLLSVVRVVLTRNAEALLLCMILIFGTSREKYGDCHQQYDAEKLHHYFPSRVVPE